MQIDLFSQHSPWQYYIYTALLMMLNVFSGYALLRSRRRVSRRLRSLAFWLLKKPIKLINSRRIPTKDSADPQTITSDVAKQKLSQEFEMPKVLKWAASSGRTDVVRNILQNSARKPKITRGSSGKALKLAIQYGHTEAAILLINTGEGLS